MRTFISIFFVLALLLPFATIFGWLSIERQVLRKNVKHELMKTVPEDELIALTFPREDTTSALHWEHAGEFEYRGEMYDIARRNYSDDEVTYRVWWDHEETELNRQLTQLSLIHFSDSPIKEKSDQQLSFFMQQLFAEQFESSLTDYAFHPIEHVFGYLRAHTNSVCEVDPPPPRC